MRVLILSQYFHPEPDLKCLPLARHLLEQGHDVRVLTGFPNYPGGTLYTGYRLKPWMHELIDGVPVLRVASYLSHNRSGFQRALSYLSFAAATLLALPMLRFRPQAVYVYNLVTLLPVAAVARMLWGTRVVLDVQDLWPESVAASGMMGRGEVPSILSRLCDLSYRSADAIAAQSPGFRDRLLARGVSSVRAKVVYNWATDESPVASQTTDRDRSFFQVVYAGNIGTVQGLYVVIEAARLLRHIDHSVRFVLIGAGVEYDRLRVCAASLPNIELRDRVPPSEVAPLLASASALLLHLVDQPIFRITIPSKVQQYLQVGRPVLCGVEGDASSIIRDAQAGLCFRSGDPEDLVRAVCTLKSLPNAARESMGRAGAAYYRSHLATEHGLRVLTELLGAG